MGSDRVYYVARRFEHLRGNLLEPAGYAIDPGARDPNRWDEMATEDPPAGLVRMKGIRLADPENPDSDFDPKVSFSITEYWTSEYIPGTYDEEGYYLAAASYHGHHHGINQRWDFDPEEHPKTPWHHHPPGSEDEQDRDPIAEADMLLDQARIDTSVLRAERFQYVLARARLAARRGDRDEAAAFAWGALWQAVEDEHGPLLPYHPDVGRVAGDRQTFDELAGYIDGGDAEAYDQLVDEYRSPADGEIRWHWSLILRLRPNPQIVGPRHDEVEAARRETAPLLRELRDAGLEAYELGDFASFKLPSKKAAQILVDWLPRVENALTRTQIATALTDARARSVAAQPLLDLFEALPNDAAEKDRVAAAAGTLARDPQFEQVARLVIDPAHGRYRDYLFWAIGYMKDPQAVDLCLELLEDESVELLALGALGDLVSIRARPALEAIAGESTSRKRDVEAKRQRTRVNASA